MLSVASFIELMMKGALDLLNHRSDVLVFIYILEGSFLNNASNCVYKNDLNH